MCSQWAKPRLHFHLALSSITRQSEACWAVTQTMIPRSPNLTCEALEEKMAKQLQQHPLSDATLLWLPIWAAALMSLLIPWEARDRG